MTDDTPEDGAPEEATPDTAPEVSPETKKTVRRVGWGVIAVVAILALLFGTGILTRYGVLSGPGRDLVSGFVNGKKLGRYGRINVYGLKGDLWDDFTLERVTVTDAKGVWLEARNVRVDWTYAPLLQRRFHADLIEAEVVRLIRRPEVEPDVEPPQPLPLSIDIDRFQGRVELLAGFSEEYGRWTLSGNADLDRAGRKAGAVRAESLTNRGDYLDAEFDLGGAGEIKLDAEAFERAGGALAGALGFSPDREFVLLVKVEGDAKEGRGNALLKSGDDIPLTAEGFWNARGARASGRAFLASSTLLRPWVERLGPEARFGLSAIPARGGDYGFGSVLITDNLTARTQGGFDPETRASVGPITVDVRTGSLTRLAGRELGGPARYAGRWSGDFERWALDGTLTAEDARGVDYALSRIEGPVRVRFAKGRIDADVALSGRGGRGQGLVAGLLGGAPRAEAALARLPDGRLLMERVELVGSGVRVEGSGSRGLAGGLNFSGRATVSNLGALRPDASGQVDGTFRAAQRGRGGWTFAFDARGRRFDSGLDQLDRLLGASPRLRAGGDIGGDGVLRIERAQLNGSALDATARGRLGLGGRSDLGFDWRAHGPFRAGPVEITGAANGRGTLTGSLARPRVAMDARFAAIDLGPLDLNDARLDLVFAKTPSGGDGRVSLVGDSGWGPARGASEFRFASDGVRLTDLDVDAAGVRAQGAVALRRGAPSSADLTFAAGPGAFVARGTASGRVRLTEGGRDALAVVQVSARDFRLAGSEYTFRTLELNGQGTLANLPFSARADVAGATPIRFDGTGVYSRVRDAQTITLQGRGAIREVPFATNAPLRIALQGPARSLSADLSISGGRLVATARQDARALDASATMTDVRLDALSPALDGRVSGAARLSGRGATLTGSLDARLEDARAADAPRGLSVDGTVRAQLSDERLALNASVFDDGGVRADTTLDLPVTASAAPLRLAVRREAPMSGRFAAQGEIQPIWDLLVGGDRRLSGRIDAAGTIAGSLNAPRLNGRAALASGRFDDAATGLTLREVGLNLTFDDQWAEIARFSATDGSGGTAAGSGRINLRLNGGSNARVDLTRFQILDNDLATARASGPITVRRSADGTIALVGRLRVDRAEIAPNPPTPSGVVRMDVIEINKPGQNGEEPREAPRRASPISLDVTLTAPRGIYVEGRGLDVELSLDAAVRGTLARPVLAGEATVIRGDFEFAGKRFEFDEGGSIALSTDPDDIRLNLRAVREDPTLTAIVRVRGTASEPEITFGSEPALPQDEVLSQVLFGRSASQLSGVEAAQLAASVSSLAGGGGFDVFGNLRELAGLDRLSFAGDASGLTVAGGKYLSDDVYLELIGGGLEGPAVQVEWRPRRNVTVLSRVVGQGGARLAVRWRKEWR